MKALVFVLLAGALALGCDEKKSSEGAAPSATAAASAPAAPAAPSATVAASAAPSASAAAVAKVPTEEDYQKKAETAIAAPAAADSELTKLDKEIGN